MAREALVHSSPATASGQARSFTKKRWQSVGGYRSLNSIRLKSETDVKR